MLFSTQHSKTRGPCIAWKMSSMLIKNAYKNAILCDQGRPNEREQNIQQVEMYIEKKCIMRNSIGHYNLHNIDDDQRTVENT